MPSRPSCVFLPTESADLPVPLVAGDGGVQTRTRQTPSWGLWSLRPLQGGVTGALSRPGSAPGLGGGFGTHLSPESSGGPFPVPPRDRDGREGLRRCGLRPAGPPAARGRTPHKCLRQEGGSGPGDGGQGPFLSPLDDFPAARNGCYLQVKGTPPGEGRFRRCQVGGHRYASPGGGGAGPPGNRGRGGGGGAPGSRARRGGREPAGSRAPEVRGSPHPGSRRRLSPQHPQQGGAPPQSPRAGKRGQTPPPPGRARPGAAARLLPGPTSPSPHQKVKQETVGLPGAPAPQRATETRGGHQPLQELGEVISLFLRRAK